MNDTSKPSTVWFRAKGQVFIPSWLRKEFAIQEGTRAIVTATSDGILLKPVTATLIKRGRGAVKRKPGDKPMTEWWPEHKREQNPLERNKDGRRREEKDDGELANNQTWEEQSKKA
ncbi:MAG: AbrB/MazE/SpoVT family DNA-binding domain-containing protein [Pseudomonadota bacterium]|nr:AbrB/MazE/SpoVT family DNA-binding domain-containing protein [Pseudomonadota bacterium]